MASTLELVTDIELLKEELREVGVAFERLSNAVLNATKALDDLSEVPLMDLEDSIQIIADALRNANGRA
jgi:hypothetical protein